MSTTFIAALMAGMGLSGGALYARHYFGKLAIAAACKNAEAAIEQFKKDNNRLRPLSQKFRDVADAFHDMLQEYKTKREAEMAVLRQYRIPKPEISVDLNELDEPKIMDVKLFISRMTTSAERNMKRAVIRNIQARLREIRLAEMTAAAAAGGVVLDSAGKITEDALRDMDKSFQDTYRKMMEQMKPELEGLRKNIDDLISETHIADVAAAVSKTAHNVGVNVMGEEAYHQTSAWLEGVLDHSFMDPVNWRGMTTGYYEWQALKAGDTDIAHSLAEGGMAVGLKAAAHAIAIATGVGMVGMLAYNIASGVANNLILRGLNKNRTERYNAILAAIEARLESAQIIIDGIAKEFDDAFQSRVEMYPDINDEPTLNEWLENFVESFNRDLQTAELAVAENAQAAIADLPQNDWRDTLLGIDRREAVANVYRRAQRDVHNHHASATYAFTHARDTHAVDALLFLKEGVVFASEDTKRLLDRMETVANATEEEHIIRYNLWHDDITQFKEVQGGIATEAMMKEARAFNAYKASRIPDLEALSKKINQTRKRMGAKPAPQPRAT